MNTFSPEDLLQYMYNETSNTKTAAIKAALENDWTLREAYETLVSAQKKLEKVELSPRDEAIKKILEHAQHSESVLHPH